MRLLLLLCSILILNSCKSRHLTASSPEKYNMEILAEVIGDKKLMEIYPEAQIAQGVEFFEQGTIKRAYTILYPHTSDKILVVWRDKKRTKLHQIYVDGENRWKSLTGIRIGTTYDELVELNGVPPKFHGFGWDYSGAVDWNDGGLADSNIRVFLEPKIAPPRSFFTDEIIETTEDEIEALQLQVRAIIFQLPEKKEIAQIHPDPKKKNSPKSF